MQTVKIKLTKIQVPDFERKGKLVIRFYYKLNNKEEFIEKTYNYIVDNPDVFAANTLAQIKSACRNKVPQDYSDEGVLGGYVNVQLEEMRSGLTEEKLSNAVKQVSDRVRDIKGMSTSNNYMMKYMDVKGIIVNL